MTFFGVALLTAIGTAVLAAFAVVTAWYARKAFREQSKAARAIERQVKDGREVAKQQADALKVQSDQLELQQRQFDEGQTSHRRAQAAQVFILIDRTDRLQAQVTLKAVAHNTSDQPVYDLWVQWRTDDGVFGTPQATPHLLPHATQRFEQVWTADAGISGIDVSLDFRDAAGMRWRTTGRGLLTELCADISPHLARSYCTFAPRHDGRHSWE